ncbi:MAG: LEA type 2 family protein [Rhodocyclaceae bacterium]
MLHVVSGRFKRWFQPILCVLLVLSLAGCSSLRWQKPQIALDSARVAGGNLQDTRVQLTLRINNPNAREVIVDSVRFDVLVAGEKIGTGQRVEPVTIAAKGETRVELDTRFRTLELLQLMRQAMQVDGTLAYSVVGEAEVRDFGRQTFNQPGSLAVPRLLQSK